MSIDHQNNGQIQGQSLYRTAEQLCVAGGGGLTLASWTVPVFASLNTVQMAGYCSMEVMGLWAATKLSRAFKAAAEDKNTSLPKLLDSMMKWTRRDVAIMTAPLLITFGLPAAITGATELYHQDQSAAQNKIEISTELSPY